MKKWLSLILTALLFVSGCAVKKNTPLPPGAINAFDAQSYDALSTIKGAIDGIKSAGVPSTAKPAVNDLIVAYNAADAAWQAYHSGASTDQQAVTQAITNAQSKLAAAQSSVGGKK